MAKKLLIATLGTSPAVVTEAIDLLNEEGARPDGVILLRTQDSEVRESFDLLNQHLRDHDGIMRIEPVCIAAYEDITTSESAVEFMQEACRILKIYRDNGDRLFVSIAGGRKAMASLLALAVQFYGAERLFHIWAPPWLEEEGEINQLRKLPSEQVTKKLHPPLANVSENDRPRIVDLPFIGLFPLLGDILDALKGQAFPVKDVKRILEANGLLTPQGQPTLLGRKVASILENVEGLPPARQEKCKLYIGKHHYQNKLDRFAREMGDHFPFITEIHSDEWRQGEEQVKAQPPNKVIVGTHLRTDILFRLCIVTTAANLGQLEAARRAIEKYVKQRG